MREVLRQEKKFYININEAYKLNHLLSNVLKSDEHNATNGYLVRSLYFDTIDDRDFYDKINGYELRRKIRLRIYNPDDDYAMLELKQKEGKYQRKRSIFLNKDDAIKMSKGDYSVLLKYSNPLASECYFLLNNYCYKPKTIVEYRRIAYIAKENNIRITFDSDIKATETCFDIFSKNLSLYPVFNKFNYVLEVKYNGFLLSYIKDLLNNVNCSEVSISKYCLARSVSMQI